MEFIVLKGIVGGGIERILYLLAKAGILGIVRVGYQQCIFVVGVVGLQSGQSLGSLGCATLARVQQP